MVTLKVTDFEPVSLSTEDDSAKALDVGLTTVVSENNYDDLRNKPSVEGVELVGDKSLNDLHGYTQTQIDTKLSAKADKSEIPSLDGYATQQWVTDKHYLTEHQSLAGYATEPWVENKGYLTQHQSLADYYTKGQTNDLLDAKADASDIPTKTSDLTNDSGFITLADLPIYNGGVQ